MAEEIENNEEIESQEETQLEDVDNEQEQGEETEQNEDGNSSDGEPPKRIVHHARVELPLDGNFFADMATLLMAFSSCYYRLLKLNYQSLK